ARGVVSAAAVYAERARLLRAGQKQIRALRGAVRGKRSGDESAGNGLAAGRALGGPGSGARKKRTPDTKARRRGGKNRKGAWGETHLLEHHTYQRTSPGSGHFRRMRDLTYG